MTCESLAKEHCPSLSGNCFHNDSQSSPMPRRHYHLLQSGSDPLQDHHCKCVIPWMPVYCSAPVVWPLQAYHASQTCPKPHVNMGARFPLLVSSQLVKSSVTLGGRLPLSNWPHCLVWSWGGISSKWLVASHYHVNPWCVDLLTDPWACCFIKQSPSFHSQL